MRLDKFLADCGCGTRSEVKKIIRAGRVSVNGAPAKQPELQVSEGTDTVCLDGQPLSYEQFSYFLLYKPAGCVTANSDGLHKTVMDYLHENAKGLSPVGRLDLDTEGVLLITNDGALSHHLLSPSHHVEKTYYVLLDRPIPEDAVRQFAEGVDIGDEKLTLPAKLTILPAAQAANTKTESCSVSLADNTETGSDPAKLTDNTKSGGFPAELTIHEGRFHQVKRMFEAVGCHVVYLKRTRMGTLTLEGLNAGEYRKLSKSEVELLKN